MRKMVVTGHTPHGHPIFHFEEEKPKMAFDPTVHEFHPDSGFIVHKDTGAQVGIHQVPVARLNDDDEWPKWIPAHDSHVVRRKIDGAPDAISIPGYDHHVDRNTGVVSVLANNPDQEKFLSGDRKENAGLLTQDAADVERERAAFALSLKRDEEQVQRERARLAARIGDAEAEAEAERERQEVLTGHGEAAERLKKLEEDVEHRRKEFADMLAKDAEAVAKGETKTIETRPGFHDDHEREFPLIERAPLDETHGA
jgi:hypothetical protein